MIVFCLVFRLCVFACGWQKELRSVQESEELLVNVAATVNNLSFYQEESSVLRHSQLAIAKCETDRPTDLHVEMKNKKHVHLSVFSSSCFCSISLPPFHSSISHFSLFLCASVMLKLVLSSSMDAMLEATRVYGNLSQSRDVRDFIMQNKGIGWTQTPTDTHKTFQYEATFISYFICCSQTVLIDTSLKLNNTQQ